MFRKSFAALVMACVAVVGGFAAAPAGAADDGTVYVVHGIPGATVDVYVNGAKTLPNFAPGTVAGPLTLPAATYQVKILTAGADPNTGTAVIDASVQLPAGANASLVAGLDASAKPTLFTFVNDVTAAPAGQGRLAVGHTAAAPAVDVLANGQAAFKNLANGKEAAATLPVGTISASVVATGTTTPVLIGPANVPVTAAMLTVVYAVGQPAAGGSASTLGVVTQQIPLAGSAGMSVHSGSSGLVDQRVDVPTWAAVAGMLALAGFLASGRVLLRSRPHA